jgi:hypothetical protein
MARHEYRIVEPQRPVPTRKMDPWGRVVMVRSRM